ncbi:MAG TPA: Ig-like domain-containing protein [Deinococcales bacterium]|nr:Ig-like domain-containing protein [Deinococcales bacterium]
MKRLYAPVALALGLALASCSPGGGNPGPGPGPDNSGVTSIVITADKSSIPVGGTATFTAAAKNASGTTVSNVSINWKSSDPSVASVSTAGVATGMKLGTTNISASVGNVTSNTVQLTVATTTQASQYLSIQHQSGKAAVNGWWGGESILVRPAAAFTTVTFDIIGAGNTVSNVTATSSSPYVITKANHAGSYSNVILRAKTANGSIAGGTTDLTLKIDNEAAGAAWTATPQGVDCPPSYNYQPSDLYPAPGTQLTWNYRAWDAGVGVARVEHYVYLNRELPHNGKDPALSGWAQEPLKPFQTFSNLGEANGTSTFRTMGGAKTHTVQAFDALGNTPNYGVTRGGSAEGESGFPADPNRISVCNDYRENGQFGHTMPRIAGVAVGTATVSAGGSGTMSATGVFPAPPAGEGCNGCVTQPDYTATIRDVNFYRRPLGAYTQPFEYVGTVTTTQTGTVSLSSLAWGQGAPGQYEIGAQVVNSYWLQNFIRGDQQVKYTLNQ